MTLKLVLAAGCLAMISLVPARADEIATYDLTLEGTTFKPA